MVSISMMMILEIQLYIYIIRHKYGYKYMTMMKMTVGLQHSSNLASINGQMKMVKTADPDDEDTTSVTINQINHRQAGNQVG